MNILERIQNNLFVLDGALGTELIKRGMKPGESSESLNLSCPEEVVAVHKAYYDAGADMVSTNTFGINGTKYSDDEIASLVSLAVKNAEKARKESTGRKEKYIALDIGPSGKMLKPYGDLEFEDAVEAFAKVIRAAKGVDCIFIETFNDCLETKAAVIAAKENSTLPVFVSNAYSSDGRLMSGTSPEAMCAMLEGLGVDAIGCNCSLGPNKLLPVIEKIIASTSLPVLFKPNAGLPRVINGATSYDCSAEFFAKDIKKAFELGVRMAGGCCGTDPGYIKLVAETAEILKPADTGFVPKTVVSSSKDALSFGTPVIIGERINPTGKKKLQEALKNNDIPFILKEALAQEEAGALALDVNVGAAGIDEEAMLPFVTAEIQNVTSLPLQIDSGNAKALEKACRIYCGKPLINSVNGKKESMEAVFPVAKKYGGVVICLTLDENGIPTTAEGRFEIAKRILTEAGKYGIEKENLLFDPLAMTVASDSSSALTTLKTLELITSGLGCGTSLGVSNISHGLPNRDYVTAAFFVMALGKGLKAAIANPLSFEVMKAYKSFLALSGQDPSCLSYIDFANAVSPTESASAKVASTLEEAVLKGLKKDAENMTGELLKTEKPLDIINGKIIPALDTVGKKFENKEYYLPQLLASAEAASAAFGVIKENSPASAKNGKKLVLTTVKGDIHDIGKNIVKLLLENYGYDVTDLGKDVDKSVVLDAVMKTGAKIVGLSALMTTTLKAMEETISIVKKYDSNIKIIVGGAVLTEEYALKIGADYYAKDAMETVRIANSLNS